MFYLLLAIIFSTLIIITFRIMSKENTNVLYAITFNYFFATILGFIFWKEHLSVGLITGKSWFWLSILIGVFFIITFFLISKSTAKARCCCYGCSQQDVGNNTRGRWFFTFQRTPKFVKSYRGFTYHHLILPYFLSWQEY